MKGLLLDVEGTTTPVAFVVETLFPYAAEHLAAFVLEGHADPHIEALQKEYQKDTSPGKPAWEAAGGAERTAALLYLSFLMSVDRKSTALKAIQGGIWLEGYERGELRGEVYPDVRGALVRCHERGVPVAIFSSGSVLSQELLFSSVPGGDLRPWLSAYFDTATGSKTNPESYRRIAKALGLPPGDILFVSDTASELQAAQDAGLLVRQCVRAGSSETTFDVIRAFDDLPG